MLRRVLGLALVAVLVNLPLAGQWWQQHQLDAHGRSGQAVVTRFGPDGLVQYRLAGRLFTARIGGTAYDEARTSHRLPVTYLPTDPARNAPVGEVRPVFVSVVTALADVGLVVVAWLLLRHRRRLEVVEVDAGSPVDPVHDTAPGIVSLANGLEITGTVLDARRGRIVLGVPTGPEAPGGRVVVHLGEQRNRAALRDTAKVRGTPRPRR